MPDKPDTQDLKAFLTEWSHWLDATRIRMRKLDITREKLDRIPDVAARDQHGDAIGLGLDQRPPSDVVSGSFEPSISEGTRAGERPFWASIREYCRPIQLTDFIGGLIDAELPTWRHRLHPAAAAAPMNSTWCCLPKVGAYPQPD